MVREPARNAATTPIDLEGSRAVFDRATRLARALFGDVDSTITLKLESGFWRSRSNETVADAASIREVMRRGEVVWSEDCAKDPRFCNEAAVMNAPHVRFYAGAPIRLADGSTPGALSVLGLTPRAYDASLARRLQDLADFVADEWARVNAERGQMGAEHTMGAIVDAMPVSVVLTDRDVRVLYASPAWIKARGLEGVDVVGKTLFELRPEIFEPWREGIFNCMDGHSRSLERVPFPQNDGSQGWAKVELAPWLDVDGAVGGLIVSSYDITHFVEALDRIERSEERLRVGLELAELHVYEMDYVRGELFKVGAEDSFYEKPMTYPDLAKDIWVGIDPRDRARVKAEWARHEHEGVPYQPEHRVARSDGQEIWAAGTAKLITDEAGRPLRLVGALRNITARKASEQALVQAKDEAEAANRAKSAFLATMSHEIRTPLNGVLGMAQAMAADADLSETQRGRIEVIKQSGETLLTILNDVLDLSKIEAGKLDLETAQFELDDLARSVHATFQAIADTKGLDFELSVDKAAQGVYEGDQVRIRQILWNLVSNALKFTDKGGVKVRIGRERDALSLTVFDSGIGMTAFQLAGLFRKFAQADASTTRKFGGTGLGLAICRELAEAMGGTVSATSAPGMGSTFTAILPLKKVARATPKPKKPARAKARSRPAEDRPVRVLAAEDNAMNQLVLKTLLSQVGIEPEIVGDGRAALEAWEREAWDVILMDVQMPVMDGPTATAMIRARERSEGRARTPIVALTANAMPHQIAEYLESGMDAFVAKPIEAQRLYEALQIAVDGVADARTAAA
ncbi:MAG: response regulator [Phenylobacterium sp.]|uniref:ATP-binding protein n=1 Tax=Phenylobacterium sp. TaxID=1871053 RepID=UPI0011F61FAF|nr:ATP-binding protein [Phenylobacterium sp.]TAJ69716.1 MAG: response regulator [Phenylobacterium sp.]